MKQVIKKLAFHSGLLRISSRINRKVLTILFYHGFSHPTENNGLKKSIAKHLNIDDFEGHLKLITRYCTPISLDQALVNKRLPVNPIVLTFDDGYKNNYTYAFPLLRKYKVPATIFVTTGFIDQTNFLWTDRLEYIIDNTDSQSSNFQWQDCEFTLELSTEKERRKTTEYIKNYLKTLPEYKKLLFLDKIDNPRSGFALYQCFDRSVRKPEQLQHLADSSHTADVFFRGAVYTGLFLGGQEDIFVLIHRIRKRIDRLGAAHKKRGNHMGKHDDIPQRQKWQKYG